LKVKERLGSDAIKVFGERRNGKRIDEDLIFVQELNERPASVKGV
jgi:hypothetical protein